jgi:hypothetical protein
MKLKEDPLNSWNNIEKVEKVEKDGVIKYIDNIISYFKEAHRNFWGDKEKKEEFTEEYIEEMTKIVDGIIENEKGVIYKKKSELWDYDLLTATEKSFKLIKEKLWEKEFSLEQEFNSNEYSICMNIKTTEKTTHIILKRIKYEILEDKIKE